MSKAKAYLVAFVFCGAFPIRWWEGKPIFAMTLMVLSTWSIRAGNVVHPFYFSIAVVLLVFEMPTLSSRVDAENSRLESEL